MEKKLYGEETIWKRDYMNKKNRLRWVRWDYMETCSFIWKKSEKRTRFICKKSKGMTIIKENRFHLNNIVNLKVLLLISEWSCA